MLSDIFEKVTVVERDALPTTPVARKGVPQSEQLHALMPLGADLLEELFPGWRAEMDEHGCPTVDEVRDALYWTAYGWRARGESDVALLGFTRTLLEHVVRDRVRGLPNVEFRVGAASGLATTPDRTRVTGVKVGHDVLEADLVVDASGRGSQAPKWMESIGYERPEEMHVRVYMGYASRLVRLPAGAIPGGAAAIGAMPYPGANRGGAILGQEGGLHKVIAAGMMKEYPPGDEQGFIDFLGDSPIPFLREVVLKSEPVGEIKTYRMPGNQRRLWERLERQPRGFIVTGDAVGSYNPIYGQGMTIAAHGAIVLRDLLARLDGALDQLPELFQAKVGEAVEWAFSSASALDTSYAGAELENIPEIDQEDAEYYVHLEELATADHTICRAIDRSFGYMEPELLVSAEVKAKVAAWVASGRKLQNTDPLTPPPVSSAVPQRPPAT
ncbi:FAD-dependent oxidoreductase [Nocardia sp. CA-107356]|uniref:FAD-dependent oxidoreductase n=1 Tax=Nocardia sp. CA-107356 TaxID=3239972 RepID=UPI003D8CC2B8